MLLLRLLFLHEGFHFVAFEPLLDSLLSENKQTNKLKYFKYLMASLKSKTSDTANTAKFCDDQKHEVFEFTM